MSYRIKRNIYAPKLKDVFMDNIHQVCYDKCNYHCGFCNQRNTHKEQYHDYSEFEFTMAVQVLLQNGNAIKFTGGEPTLCPTLERDLRIVKNAGGLVFLDTNGSRPKILQHLLEEGLIDVMALSLKGLDEQEAVKTAEIKNTALCWDNVIRSISLANDYEKVHTILTIVIDDKMDARERLDKAGNILLSTPNIRLKINNLHENKETRQRGMKAQDPKTLEDIIADFVTEYPEFKNRIIYEPDRTAVKDYSKLVFF